MIEISFKLQVSHYAVADILDLRAGHLEMTLYLLDYGAGNVASLANSLKKLGHDFTWISSPEDFAKADASHLLPPLSGLPYTDNLAETHIPRSRCFQTCNG